MQNSLVLTNEHIESVKKSIALNQEAVKMLTQTYLSSINNVDTALNAKEAIISVSASLENDKKLLAQKTEEKKALQREIYNLKKEEVA